MMPMGNTILALSRRAGSGELSWERGMRVRIMVVEAKFGDTYCSFPIFRQPMTSMKRAALQVTMEMPHQIPQSPQARVKVRVWMMRMGAMSWR